MGHINVTKKVSAPVELVFGYVDDYRNTTKYMQDLTKWQPVGTQTHGKGSQFAVAMKAGPATLDSSVEITTWAENKEIGWVSLKGFKQNGTWTFKSAGSGTQVGFDMEYEFPGGIAGRLLSKVAEPIVRHNLEKSVEELRLQTEKLAAAQPAKPATKAAASGATAKATGNGSAASRARPAGATAKRVRSSRSPK